METDNGYEDTAVVVFDSGIGGLNLLYECAVRAPHMHYYYVSDNAHVPYGNKSAEEILRLTLSALDGVESLNPAALVVACNTVTAQCIGVLRERFSFPVIGIQPAVKQAARTGGRCLVLATESTVRSESFRALVARYHGERTEVVGCPSLAEYIENNIFNLTRELPQGLLPSCKADSVVLGCTHYAFIKEQISNWYGCPVYDGMAGTAAHFSEIVGTAAHFCPTSGTNDHLSPDMLKITFYRGENEQNEQIFKYLFKMKTNKR